MTKELSSFGDHAQISMQSNVAGSETVGIEGVYHVVCRDAEGNVKWEDQFPNLVNAVGKELMLDTLLSGTSYTTVGPFLGLISGASPTFAAADTMTSHIDRNNAIAQAVDLRSAAIGWVKLIAVKTTANKRIGVGSNCAVERQRAGQSYTCAAIYIDRLLCWVCQEDVLNVSRQRNRRCVAVGVRQDGGTRKAWTRR